MMNCDEYRQAISAEPRFDGGAGHAAGCESCREYRDEMLALDARIARALAIDVPPLDMPDLQDVDTSKVTRIGRGRLSPPAWLAVAATIVLASFVGVRLFDGGGGDTSLPGQILAHLPHESFAVKVSNEAVPAERLRSVVATDVARFDSGSALITYAQTCEINGRDVPHLVMQGENGPVVIILMPEEKVSAALPFGDGNVQGVILPVGSGSIAIVGSPGESFDDVERTVLNSVTWKT
jgi:hypothetical protein